MPPEDPSASRVEEDANIVEEKFGAEAAVYAETRREAAEAAGNEDGSEHWEEVAEAVQDDDASKSD